MRITVNDKKIIIFQGATVKDALLRLFSKNGISRDTLMQVTAYDQWGHELDLDSPLREDTAITYEINQQEP